MLIFALDTSSPTGSVAALQDHRVIGTVSTWTDETYSSRMFRHIEFLLHELSLSLDRFDLFAVTAGPGSFTGLRVGLAAVKGWAEVYNRPIAAIGVLECVAAQSHASAGILAPVVDARRGQVYFGFYRRREREEDEMEQLGEPCVMNPGELLEAVRERARDAECTIVTPTPEAVSADLARLNASLERGRQISIEAVPAVLAPVAGRIGYFRAKRGDLVSSLTLDASYVRRTDAELQWKGHAV